MEALKSVASIAPITPEPTEQQAKLSAVLTQGLKTKNLTGALNEYIEKHTSGSEQRQKTNGLEHFRNYFQQKYPNIKVHQVRDDHIIEYKKELEQLTSHKSKEKLKLATVIKRLRFISVFFNWCSKTEQKYLAKGQHINPVFDLIPDEKQDPTSSYERFSAEELQKIFNAENYKLNFKTPIGYWVPLIGLFTGASRGEIINLNPSNVNNHNSEKVYTIRFEANTKNLNSKRTIPLPQSLIDLGFLVYLEDLKRSFPMGKTIFPFSCDVDKSSLRYFTRLLERVNIKSPTKVFHSFPKTVSDVLSLSKIEDKYQQHFIGHLAFSIHRNIYTSQQDPLSHYKKLIDEALIYPYLDLTDFHYQSGMFEEYFQIEQMMIKRPKRGKSK